MHAWPRRGPASAVRAREEVRSVRADHTMRRMTYTVPARLAILQRDTAAFNAKLAHAVVGDTDVRGVMATAMSLRDRARSIAHQMGQSGVFDGQESGVSAGTLAMLNPAYFAPRTVTQRTGYASHEHAPVTIAGNVPGSDQSAAVWSAGRGAALLPNVRIQGAIADDAVRHVQERLSHVPPTAIALTNQLGARSTLFAGVLTDVYRYRSLRGVHPRGWPAGATWDQVPGAGSGAGAAVNPEREERGMGHGSTSLSLHEFGHVVDHAIASPRWRVASASPSFQEAWKEMRDRRAPTAYLRDHPEEWFAESFARYTKTPQSAAALARWYPATYSWLRRHIGSQSFS